MYKYNDYFTFTVSDPDKTDLVLVSLHDSRTNYTVRTALPNSGKQTASIMAFAGARYSRSDLSAQDLFKEIKEAKKTANEKLAAIFRNYGHASVADMAQLFAYIENIPQIHACKFYNETSVGGGQERSTRYQDFSENTLDNLDNYFTTEELASLKNSPEYTKISQKFTELQELSFSNYRKYVDILSEKYTEVYEIDSNDKKQTGALTARVFDSARYFLLSGTSNRTSICWITAAREWARIISQFKASKAKELNHLAEQLELLFAPDSEFATSIGYTPEAPDLIRYTSADETTSSNIVGLQTYLLDNDFLSIARFDRDFGYKELKTKLINQDISAGLKVIAQNILTIYPTLDEEWLITWLNALSDSRKEELSSVVLKNYNHHQQMGGQFRINTHSFVLYCSVGEGRDLNRHRAWGRFIPIIAAETDYLDNYNLGYTLPAYLTENPLLSDVRESFEADLINYYQRLKEFMESIEKTEWFPKYLFLQLLPFAHVMKMWFHGSPKEISYLTKLRVRPGGHINYRMLAYQMAYEAGQSDPFLKNLTLNESEKPDPSSRAEFIDRG